MYDFAEVSGVACLRRFYLRKRLAALRSGSTLAETWQGHQEAEPGTALPDDFPDRAALVASTYYKTVEDLAGADAEEIQNNVGLPSVRAEAVIAAVYQLL